MISLHGVFGEYSIRVIRIQSVNHTQRLINVFSPDSDVWGITVEVTVCYLLEDILHRLLRVPDQDIAFP